MRKLILLAAGVAIGYTLRDKQNKVAIAVANRISNSISAILYGSVPVRDGQNVKYGPFNR